MLTQVQRGESAPRVTGQYTQGLMKQNHGGMGSRNQQRAANSMAPQQRHVSKDSKLQDFQESPNEIPEQISSNSNTI